MTHKLRVELFRAMSKAREKLEEAVLNIDMAKQAFEEEPIINATTGLEREADAAKAIVEEMLGTVALWLKEEVAKEEVE